MWLHGRHYGNLEELEADAEPRLSVAAYGYYASGSESEHTLRDNRAAFSRYRLLPRALQDVADVDTSCHLFGQRLSLPVLVAPMAMQRLCHDDGELAMARAAGSAQTTMIVSTMANCSVDEVAATGSPGLWFQVYVLTRRDATEALVRQAEDAGYKAIVITVDAPRLGNRERDARNKLAVPPGHSLRNLEWIASEAGQGSEAEGDNKFGAHFTSLVDASLTWEIISWIKSFCSLPILVKGILAPDDARRAVQHGADGIVVSNHGGRQLDFAPAALDVLPHVVAAVRGRVPILVDGGVRRGSDVIKCLALGASAVLVGRPLLWALAVGGQGGVEAALEMLRGEVELGMALLGCRRVADINADFVLPPAVPPFHIPAARL